ncbi:tRNA lysidine(34) synthetase TilS [Paroceanicella profunda]|uniref:tRNA lysidine(34) synthetase TilS n=1 Tax=Paroceanicella profunda TaxID=2579971 RepID=UPI0014781412|nr:tRNA lysidine(34) synthetase TilS [Paroceanicella profunda]
MTFDAAASAAAAALAAGFSGVPGEICLAVSGGGDSLALLALAADWAAATGHPLSVATVDHRLRAEAAAEAAAVAARCAALDLPHATLAWDGGPGAGNLSQAARDARRALLSGHAAARGAAAVALAHTADDQAETFLMRLARGSGVGGLAGMAARSEVGGVLWLRPLLGIRRDTLRDVLRARGWGWAEDPSNLDARFDRVKARRALDTLAPLGLDVPRLVATASRMAEARDALDHAGQALAAAALSWSAEGEACLRPAPLRAAPRSVRLQLLADLLTAVSGRRHPPRRAALERAAEAMLGAEAPAGSLHGCLWRRRGEGLVLRREPRACPPPVPARRDQLWDGRWRVRCSAPVPEGLSLAALGPAGLAVTGRPPGGVAAETLHATPAIWHNDSLIAAPACGYPADGRAAAWSAEWTIEDARRRRVLTCR